MERKISRISFCLPILNEVDNIKILYEKIKEVCKKSNVNYEMLFIDDGSTDGSLDLIKVLRSDDKEVKYISLSRNFGHQNAFFAGMSYATGDAVVTMDADLQHPPSLVPDMIDLWRNGAEVVYTTKKESRLPLAKSLIVKCSYWFISKISGLKLSFGQSDFRLLDRKVLKVILEMPEYHKFLRGQVSWIGFRQKGLSYNVNKRHSGSPKYSYKTLYELALNGIFSFGKYPLHLVMILSLLIFGTSLVYIFSILFLWLLKILNIAYVPMPPGWTTLTVSIFLLGSIQLITIGILSEYVGRIYDQTKGRPSFIIRETSEASE